MNLLEDIKYNAGLSQEPINEMSDSDLINLLKSGKVDQAVRVLLANPRVDSINGGQLGPKDIERILIQYKVDPINKGKILTAVNAYIQNDKESSVIKKNFQTGKTR